MYEKDNQKWVANCVRVDGKRFVKKFESTQDLDNYRKSIGVGFSAHNSKVVRIVNMKKVDNFNMIGMF